MLNEQVKPMQSPRRVLTPDALAMLQAIARAGSFAAAARDLGVVPSALTYRVRVIEDALDVLLFDRSALSGNLASQTTTSTTYQNGLLNSTSTVQSFPDAVNI